MSSKTARAKIIAWARIAVILAALSTSSPVLAVTCEEEAQCPPGQACSHNGDKFAGQTLAGAAGGVCLPRGSGTACSSQGGGCSSNETCYRPASAEPSLTLDDSLDKGYCVVSAVEAPAVNPTQNLNLVAPKLEITIPGLSFSQPIANDGNISLPYLSDYIKAVYNFLITIVGIVAAMMIMIGGFQYLTSGGDKNKVEAGKQRIVDALFGLVLAFGSYLLLYTINPALVRFDSLKLAKVSTELAESEEAKTDPAADDASGGGATAGPAGSCATPGFAITDASAVDTGLSKNKQEMAELEKKLKDGTRIEAYKKAADSFNIPWEVVAATHKMEAGMDMGASILNGHALCNTKDNPNLLSECPACKTPTSEHDLYCGAKHLARTAGLSKDNLQAIKLAFCRFNGCGSARAKCPELHPYVAPFFDSKHTGYYKSGIDCVSYNCREGCLADITQKGSVKSYGAGCCEIKIYKAGQEPAGYDPGGSKCQANQKKACKTSETGDTATYTYHNGPRDSANPCGSTITQERIGALTVYALILKLEESGKIPR
jgi:lysozyme family protein